MCVCVVGVHVVPVGVQVCGAGMWCAGVCRRASFRGVLSAAGIRWKHRILDGMVLKCGLCTQKQQHLQGTC